MTPLGGRSATAAPVGAPPGFAVIDGPFQQRALLYVEEFLRPMECALLVGCFERNRDKLAKSSDGVPFFDDRFLRFRAIPRQEGDAKTIMQRSRREIVERVRKFYGEPAALYSDDVQLVKWHPGQPMQPHADNAFPDGAPHPTPHRHFASIVYLNDGYVGGQLYFDTLKLVVVPRKGLLVGFKGDLAHQHAVGEVLIGDRYTMAAWYTRDIERRDPTELEPY